MTLHLLYRPGSCFFWEVIQPWMCKIASINEKRFFETPFGNRNKFSDYFGHGDALMERLCRWDS